MSLVFTCIAAHTPLLMPTISKDNINVIAKTRDAMLKLEQEIYLSQPETLIVITPHGNSLPDTLTINCSPEYVTNFEEFGDLVTKSKWRCDVLLVDRIREDFKKKEMPLILDSSESLDYGSAVPLWYLTQHLPKVKVIPLLTSNLDNKTHYEFGKELKDEIMSSTKRVAVIASADLSHRVGENSPQGLSPRGIAYDEKIMEILNSGDLSGMMDIDDGWASEAAACGSKVLTTLAGVMDEVKNETKVISYEKPLGVGYMVASMKIA